MQDQSQDIRIWNQFRQGDDEAFACLFNKFSEVLYRYGSKLMTKSDGVKDCIADLFIQLHHKRNALPLVDNVKSYLLKSLRNKMIDHIRKEKIKGHAVSLDELQFQTDYYFDPEENTDLDSEIMEKFESVLQQLTDRQKEILYLHYQMDLSYEDISLLLEINYQSVKNLMFRTIENIRNKMVLPLFLSFFLRYIL